jgi:glycosyltransferase involved in cell wall biosynthesis
VFVYPSHVEGMPLAVLEALATGRPVITTDTPGCRETVDEKVSGCLVPPGDSEALMRAMRSFLKRPDLIPSLSRAARLKAERRFDSTDVNRTVESVLGLA